MEQADAAGQPAEAFDVDAWARDRARAKLGRVLLRQSQRKADATPPAATPPLPLTATIPPPEAAAALDPVQAARRLQHVARRRLATRRSIEQAMRAFARDYETRPPLRWERMPQMMAIVSDFGFRAQDLTQGGVGDCWFMSALAVVADRHDLIARLFASTERNAGAGGFHLLRLFLDGAWRSVHVSDELPCSPAPRRAQLAGPHRLAFCRCADGATGAPQLWASLIEKAYAKAHGSFSAISGGQIAEALLDDVENL